MNCGFMGWVDPPMCHKALDVIHALLSAKNELEEDLEEQCMLLKDNEILAKKLRKNMVIAWILVFVVLSIFNVLGGSIGCLEIQSYVQKQCDEDNAACQEAIMGVMTLFEQALEAKEDLRKQYAKCKDILPERRIVIQKF
ncbi:hypothetical protein Tco_0845925 [Tanacetum coccineum]